MGIYGIFDPDFWLGLISEFWWIVAIPCALTAIVTWLIAEWFYKARKT